MVGGGRRQTANERVVGGRLAGDAVRHSAAQKENNIKAALSRAGPHDDGDGGKQT